MMMAFDCASKREDRQKGYKKLHNVSGLGDVGFVQLVL